MLHFANVSRSCWTDCRTLDQSLGCGCRKSRAEPHQRVVLPSVPQRQSGACLSSSQQPCCNGMKSTQKWASDLLGLLVSRSRARRRASGRGGRVGGQAPPLSSAGAGVQPSPRFDPTALDPAETVLVGWIVLPLQNTLPLRNGGVPQCWPVRLARAVCGLWADQTSTGLRAAKNGLEPALGDAEPTRSRLF